MSGFIHPCGDVGTRLEHVFPHGSLRSCPVSGFECFKDPAVSHLRAPLLLGISPVILLVRQGHFQEVTTDVHQAVAADDEEQRVVEQDVLFVALLHRPVRERLKSRAALLQGGQLLIGDPVGGEPCHASLDKAAHLVNQADILSFVDANPGSQAGLQAEKPFDCQHQERFPYGSTAHAKALRDLGLTDPRAWGHFSADDGVAQGLDHSLARALAVKLAGPRRTHHPVPLSI